MEKKELRKITQEELNEVLKKHKQWCTDGKEGERADLSDVDLVGADLTCDNLYRADLSGADLSGADLSGAVLVGANLRGADLTGADLTGACLAGAKLYFARLASADLSGADLKAVNLEDDNLAGAHMLGVDLEYANLEGADLTDADLTGANLKNANLRGADLQNTDLSNVKNFPDIPMACPSEGSFIGWKTACGYIIKLEIPEDVKRSSGTGIKCRCDKAKVLAIENLDGTPADVTEVPSDYDKNFIYKVGETVTVDNFDDNRFNECAPGIHFFMVRGFAVHYSY